MIKHEVCVVLRGRSIDVLTLPTITMPSRLFKRTVVSLLIIAAVTGCKTTLFQRSAETLKCLGKTNVKYSVAPTVGSPTETNVLSKEVPVAIVLKRLTINDAVGNDLERCVLREAGLLTDSVERLPGTAISFEDEFSEEFKNALRKAAHAQRSQETNTPGTQIGFDDIVADALKKVRDELKATYILTNSVKFQSYAFDLPEKKIVTSYRFTQTRLGNSITALPRWEALIFRGQGFDLMTLDLALYRKSLIAEQLRDQLSKLEKSTFVADTLSSLLGSIPALGGAGSQVGKFFGSRVDRALHKMAVDKYGPRFDIAAATFTFMTKQTFVSTNSQPFISSPKNPDQTFYLGDRVLSAVAKRVKDDEGPITVLEVTLNATAIGQ